MELYAYIILFIFNTLIRLLVLAIHMMTPVFDNKFVLNHKTQNAEKF